jgi:hypothetical protein
MVVAIFTCLTLLVIWGYRETLARRAFIHGTVTLDDRPVAGVAIRLTSWTKPSPAELKEIQDLNAQGHPVSFKPDIIGTYETVTNGDGGFRLFFVKPGHYHVSVKRADDGERLSLRLWSGLEEVDVSAGVQTHDIWVKRFH